MGVVSMSSEGVGSGGWGVGGGRGGRDSRVGRNLTYEHRLPERGKYLRQKGTNKPKGT